MLRTSTRGNEVLVSLHYMPNCTRVIVRHCHGGGKAGQIALS
jgi:hypothetical protein